MWVLLSIGIYSKRTYIVLLQLWPPGRLSLLLACSCSSASSVLLGAPLLTPRSPSERLRAAYLLTLSLSFLTTLVLRFMLPAPGAASTSAR